MPTHELKLKQNPIMDEWMELLSPFLVIVYGM